MAQLKTYRVWYRDDSMRLVNQTGHREAAEEASELAHVQNAPAPSERAGQEEKDRYLAACKVAKTECLTDGTVKKWK